MSKDSAVYWAVLWRCHSVYRVFALLKPEPLPAKFLLEIISRTFSMFFYRHGQLGDVRELRRRGAAAAAVRLPGLQPRRGGARQVDRHGN